MNELMLLSTMRMVREPGIFEPIAIVLGKIYNMLFNGIYGSVSAGALGIAIIVFTLIVKLILFPLMMKQQKSSFKMQQLQPEMNKIRDKYKGKTDTMSQQRMALELQDFQKKNGVHLMGGCLPMLIQLPILYALYYIFQNAYVYVDVIGNNYTDIANAIIQIPAALRMEAFTPFAQDLVDTYKSLGTIALSNVNDVVMLVANIKADDWNTILATLGDSGNALLPLLDTKNNIETFLTIPLVSKCGLSFPSIIVPIVAGVTTFLQSKVMTSLMNTTASAENDQAAAMTQSMNKMMLYFMPIMMAFFCLQVPAGLGVYWTISNIFGILQQIFLQKFYKKKLAEGAL